MYRIPMYFLTGNTFSAVDALLDGLVYFDYFETMFDRASWNFLWSIEHEVLNLIYL